MNRKPEVMINKRSILELTNRQQTIVEYIKQHGSINNSQCQELMRISRITATRELKVLIDNDILIQEGTIGRGTKYKLK